MTTGIAARLNTALEGRYRIERELGTGGMATVCLAEVLKHDRKVATPRMPFSATEDSCSAARTTETTA